MKKMCYNGLRDMCIMVEEEMRIITGTARGCRLKAPKGMRTRPTSDRIKESLFSILGSFVQGKEVLDLFAGTGSLGLEALSRGAAHAVFVDRATVDILRDNAEHTRLSGQSEILRGDVFSILPKLKNEGRSFQLIFCDPPYHEGLWENVLEWIDGSGILSPGGLLITEHGGDEFLPEGELCSLSCIREVRYGHTSAIHIFQR